MSGGGSVWQPYCPRLPVRLSLEGAQEAATGGQRERSTSPSPRIPHPDGRGGGNSGAPEGPSPAVPPSTPGETLSTFPGGPSRPPGLGLSCAALRVRPLVREPAGRRGGVPTCQSKHRFGEDGGR